MSRTYDISSRLIDEEKFIQLGPNMHVKVNDSKNAVMQVNAIIQEKGEAAAMDEAIRILLGKKAFTDIEKMNLSLTSYQNIFIGVMGAVAGKEFEEMEKSFRE